MIQNFANIDPENFAKVDNLTYKNKSGNEINVDVVVKGGITGEHMGGFTSLAVNSTTGNISGNSINITISANFGISSNVLAHEFGHSFTIASNPVGYKDAFSVGHNCQDPANRNSFISKTAVDWQERFDDLRKARK